MRTRPPAGAGHEPETSAAVDAGPHRGGSGGLRGGLVYCLCVFLALRLALSVVALVSVALLPNAGALSENVRNAAQLPGPVDVPGWPAHAVTPGWHNVWTAWEREDALWFLRIATGGYADQDGSAAFFPLYPTATRAVSTAIGGHPLAAGILISNLSLLGAFCMLYVLTRTETSEETARRAVLYSAVFPTSFFFLAPYSESTFLLLALVCLWGARRKRWWVAAAGGAAAALTRSVGLVLILPLAVEAFLQWRESGRRGIPVGGLLACLGPPAGTLAYLAYWQHRAGDWLAPLHQQAGWQRKGTNPLSALWQGSLDAFHFTGVFPGGYHQLDWLIVAPALILAGYALVRFRPTFGVYVWASLIPPLLLVFEGRPLMSMPRFLLVLFPLYWAAADWTRNHPLRHELYVAGSALLLGVLLLLFVNWYYVF
jgi:Mannosyltransferase (PIG-V)